MTIAIVCVSCSDVKSDCMAFNVVFLSVFELHLLSVLFDVLFHFFLPADLQPYPSVVRVHFKFKMDKRTFKNKVCTELAGIVKAMANSHRLEILELLAQGEYSVEEIADQTDLSIANASQHLQILKRVQLVETRKEGTYVYYLLADQNVYKAWKSLRDLGMDRTAEIERIIQRFRESKQALESVSSRELAKRMRNKDVTVIDVRPEHEYREGHIAGALNVPVHELKRELKNLSEDKEIVAYCRGPFCVYADEAVELLKKEGFTAKRLEEGYPDWMLEGLPVQHKKG